MNNLQNKTTSSLIRGHNTYSVLNRYYVPVFLVLLMLVPALGAETLTVIHEKRLWRDNPGILEITTEGIQYISQDKKKSLFWSYQDIQHFDRISNKEITILSYEDESHLLGRDKSYHFVIIDGELTDALFHKISANMKMPVTNRILPEITEFLYEIPVKHNHTFGGCEGSLQFTADAIYYITNHEKDAREWTLDRNIQSIWSSDPYQLDIQVYENNRREFSKARIFKFQLKEPLNQAIYRKLKLQLYDLN